MNLNDQLRQEALSQGTPDPVKLKENQEATADLVETSDKQQEEVIEKQEKQTEGNGFVNWLLDPGDHWGPDPEPGTRSIRDLEIGSDVEGFATDPKTTWEYATSAPTGVLDSVIGTYNMVTPGPDIPQIPQYEDQGAQFVRDVSSILIPGMGWSKLLRGGGAAVAANQTGRLGAFLNNPLTRWMGNNAANLGGGALADAAAPVQGDPNGQTLLGSAKESFPRWFGWVPDNLVVLEGDSPDSVRNKNITEGTVFGGAAGLVDGLGSLARGLKGLDNATTYLPKNEQAATYFAKNKPEAAETIEDAINNAARRQNEDLAELGELNTLRAEIDGQNLDEAVIFGKDNILFDPAETAIRSSDDMGIVGAVVDQTRISKNIDTVYGRVRNPMSEAALKFSLQETGTVPKIIKQFGDALDQAGKFDYRTTTGRLVKSETMDEAINKLAADMLGMDKPQLQKFLKQFSQMREGLPRLNTLGQKGVARTIEKTLQQYGELANFNNIKAMALTEASFAGQVSDFAAATRIQDGRVGAFRSMEMMLDRMEFLQDIRGMSAVSREGIDNAKSMWARLTGVGGPKGDSKYAAEIAERMASDANQTLEALETVQADTRQFMQSLRKMTAERPGFLKPMATIYELTDGDARSVAVANNYLRNRFGVLKKAFVDGQPEIPSVMMQGFWSTMFNSALSGVKTPLKAAVSNMSTWVLKPATQVVGAYLQGDTKSLNRAMYGYSQVMDTISNGGGYMKNMWVRSSQDPTLLRARDEMVYKTSDDMLLAKQLADEGLARGDNGPAVLYDILKTQEDLAHHPLLRIGNRAMGAHDSWMQAVNGQMMARMRAWDEITKNGTIPFNKAKADKLSKNIYAQMFDENGVIKDPQVLRETARQTFSQDNMLSTGFSELMQRIPGLKPFFMFTRSPVNSATYGMSFNPVGTFIDKVNAFEKPFAQMAPDHIQRLLKNEGVDLNSGVDIAAEYTRIRNQYKGASALGVSFVMMGVYGYLSGNITGRSGLRDRQKQMARVKDHSWKPMHAFGVDYSQIPAVSDWLSLTVDIMDNAYEMESFDVGETLRAMAYVLGANLFERTQLGNVEQFQDVLGGNPAAIQRWASNVTVTSQFKVAGLLGTMNQIMAPQMKAVEQRFDQLLLNRVPGKPTLPDDYDWIDSGKIGWIENPLHRLYNALSPLPYHAAPSDTKQYLTDVEFDVQPGMASRSDGVQYTKAELAEIKRLMGEDGYFKREVDKLRKRFPADQFRDTFDAFRAEGAQPSSGDVQSLHNKIRLIQQIAKTRAESKLPDLMRDIRERAAQQRLRQRAVQTNNLSGLQRFNQRMEQIPR